MATRPDHPLATLEDRFAFTADADGDYEIKVTAAGMTKLAASITVTSLDGHTIHAQLAGQPPRQTRSLLVPLAAGSYRVIVASAEPLPDTYELTVSKKP